MQSGWTQTSPTTNTGSYVGTLSSGQIVNKLNFGVRQLAAAAAAPGTAPLSISFVTSIEDERGLFGELEIVWE